MDLIGYHNSNRCNLSKTVTRNRQRKLSSLHPDDALKRTAPRLQEIVRRPPRGAALLLGTDVIPKRLHSLGPLARKKCNTASLSFMCFSCARAGRPRRSSARPDKYLLRWSSSAPHSRCSPTDKHYPCPPVTPLFRLSSTLSTRMSKSLNSPIDS